MQLVQLVLRQIQEQLGVPVQQVTQVLLEVLVTLEVQVKQEIQEQLEVQVQRVTQVQQEQPEVQV